MLIRLELSFCVHQKYLKVAIKKDPQLSPFKLRTFPSALSHAEDPSLNRLRNFKIEVVSGPVIVPKAASNAAAPFIVPAIKNDTRKPVCAFVVANQDVFEICSGFDTQVLGTSTLVVSYQHELGPILTTTTRQLSKVSPTPL